MKKFILKFLASISIAFSSFGVNADPGCNDASIFSSSLITDVCWSCILPIRFAGANVLGGSFPPGANNMPFCYCTDPLGVPSFGFPIGSWLPFRLIETTRNPYCMPTFGGVFLMRDFMQQAGPETNTDISSIQGSYYNTHEYSFPLATMMELMTAKECNPGGYQDMDLISMSEFDPVASDPMLHLFIYFETAMFANPIAIAACGIECGQLTSGVPPSSNSMFWCAGCWGSLYPLNHNSATSSSRHTESSLVDLRELAVSHRRGFAHLTYGSDNMCGGAISPFLPKEQYKWQHVFPNPEANKPCCHWSGTSGYVSGGESRNRPYSGEDVVQLIFRYTDCCVN